MTAIVTPIAPLVGTKPRAACVLSVAVAVTVAVCVAVAVLVAVAVGGIKVGVRVGVGGTAVAVGVLCGTLLVASASATGRVVDKYSEPLLERHPRWRRWRPRVGETGSQDEVADGP